MLKLTAPIIRMPIVTENAEAATLLYRASGLSSGVGVNAPTRFTDGGQFVLMRWGFLYRETAWRVANGLEGS